MHESITLCFNSDQKCLICVRRSYQSNTDRVADRLKKRYLFRFDEYFELKYSWKYQSMQYLTAIFLTFNLQRNNLLIFRLESIHLLVDNIFTTFIYSSNLLLQFFKTYFLIPMETLINKKFFLCTYHFLIYIL